MSNHFSAANLKHPGDDARLDLTDLFVFAAPDNPDRTVLIMDSNPFLEGDGFHPDALYRFNIDSNGDSVADVAFSFTFSKLTEGRQSATAFYATGREAQMREPGGAVLIEGSGGKQETSSGRGTTPSAARTFSLSRSRYPTTCWAPVRESESG